MIFVRFALGGIASFGILEGQQIRQIEGTPFDLYKETESVYSLNEIRLLEPTIPSKVVAVGLNYTDHAKELGMQMNDEPIIFLKPPSSIIGPNEPIIYPDMSNQVDYEAELAIVIKRIAKQIKLEEADSYILGYTCANDVTARDLQKKDGQWTRAKSFDTFAPIGPWIITDINPNNLAIELRLNGITKQSSTTANMFFKPDYLVYFISHIMTLCPGDVILTGTPPGVGSMNPGDEVEVVIEGVGILNNKVITLGS